MEPLKALEAQIDVLIQTCQQLAEENRTLREQQTTLISERDALLEKNALARSRIESMIAKLKAMEVSDK
ncbi:MAG: TIGR02449 family protein [Pseudomonadota bacterium]|nr:TIGR02449 family protein [Pseudomonadota bacterium]